MNPIMNDGFPRQPTMSDVVMAVRSNDKAVARAMVLLHKRQTDDERADHYTKHVNQRGFNKWASKKASFYAEWVDGKRTLTGKHLANARRIALIHRRQLLEEAWRKWWKVANVAQGDLLVLSRGVEIDVGGKTLRIKHGSALMYVETKDVPGVWFEPLIVAWDARAGRIEFRPSDLFNRLGSVLRAGMKRDAV